MNLKDRLNKLLLEMEKEQKSLRKKLDACPISEAMELREKFMENFRNG